MELKDQSEYIKKLEKEIETITNKYVLPHIQQHGKDRGLSSNEQFLYQKIKQENEILIAENTKIIQKIQGQNLYINYLLNSYWWKISAPLRKFSKTIKRKKDGDKQIELNLFDKTNLPDPLDHTVSVIISTYNADDKFETQLEEITQQLLIKKIELIVIDLGSTDRTIELAKKYHAKIITIDKPNIDETSSYERALNKSNGDYIVYMKQNIVIGDPYWLYQSILPIKEGDTIMTCFFNKELELSKSQKNLTVELKHRIIEINQHSALLFPDNRDGIQYINPGIFDYMNIIVKKRNILF